MPESIPKLMDELGRKARSAAQQLAMSSGEMRDAALHAAAAELRARHGEIIAANETDMRVLGSTSNWNSESTTCVPRVPGATPRVRS